MGQEGHDGIPRNFLAAALVLGAGGATGWLAHRPSAAEANPLADATFNRLTDFEGVERDASISPNGQFVAFLSNRSGPLDIWVSQVGTGSAVNLTQGKTGNLDGLVRALGFSGDGTQIWFHEADVTTPELPTGPFQVIVADPPWRYESGNSLPYPTKHIEEIKAMPVAEVPMRTPSCGCGPPMPTCASPSMSSRPGASSTELCLRG